MGKTQNTKKSYVSITIVGLILSESYQKCKLFAQKLRKHYNKRFAEPEVRGYLEVDWVEYLSRLRKDIGGQTWAVRRGVVVFLDGVFFGGEDELFSRFSVYALELPTQEKLKSLAKQEYLNHLRRDNLLYTFFELSLDGKYMGSLLFELRSDLLPSTCLWFAAICDPHNNLGYSYKNSTIHRVCKRGWFQGGEVGVGSPAGLLQDESLCYKHDRRGILSLANAGKDCNSGQFFVTFKPSAWMDEYYVAFGRVVEGSDLLRRLEYTKCTYEHPDHEIKIDNCGLVGVGFGRELATKKKLRGITVGDPHIHLDTFVDLVLERFAEVLFERLDEEVKRELKGEWIGQMIWNSIQPQLITREPIADVPDSNDISSRILDPAIFIKGLYGLQDIPDHYIVDLLNEIIMDSVDVVETRAMVSSIVNLIINNLDLEGSAKSLSDSVNSIVFGYENSKIMMTPEAENLSKKELFQRSVHKVVSQTPTIRKLLTEYSTHSVSQVSYVEQEVREEPSNVSTLSKKELFRKSAQKAASVSTIRKLLTDYKSLSVSVSGDEEREGVVEGREEMSSTDPSRRSISAVASHASTVRKLLTDYKRFSVSRTKSVGIVREDDEKSGSTRESVVGYIWETLLRALFEE